MAIKMLQAGMELLGIDRVFGVASGLIVAVAGVLVALWLQFGRDYRLRAIQAKAGLLIAQHLKYAQEDGDTAPALVDADPAGRKPYVVLANPIGGNGDAGAIYTEVVKPTLDAAGIPSRLELTNRAGHAREIAAGLDLSTVGCLVLISGDGMVHEVLQGFSDQASGDAEKLRALLAQAPLGLVPGGSHNGLASSFGHFEVAQACLSLVVGVPQPLDIEEVILGDPAGGCAAPVTRLFDAHALCFGVFADHDRMAEQQLRWMGPTLKGIVAPAAVVMTRREYNCTVEFEDGGADAYSSEAEREARGYRDPTKLAAIDGEPGWRRHTGSFIGVNAFNTRWAAYDANLTPNAERGGGSVDLILFTGGPGVSRLALITTFLNFEGGGHLKQPFVEVYRAKRWRLIPDPADADRTTIDLSGEQFPLPLRAIVEVHKAMATVLSVGAEK